MADYINNLAAANVYTAPLQLGPMFDATSLVCTIANNSALAQFAVGKEGNWHWTEEREYLITPQSFRVGNVIGCRFRNATPGLVARVLAVLADPSDPDFGAGLPFTGTLSATGAIGEGGGVTGDIVWSGALTRVGSVICDGTLYDSIADPTFAALYAAIGTQFGGTGANNFAVPDMGGRMPVGVGPNAAVATPGSNEGQPIRANRTPYHNTTINDTGHAHSYGVAPAVAGAFVAAAGTSAAATVNPTSGISTTGISGGPPRPNTLVFDTSPYLALNAFIIK